MIEDAERIRSIHEAIDAELRIHHGDEEPMHYGTRMRWQLGGPDPLDGVSIYFHPDGHWHYVGFGMAEHADKQTSNAAVSGWGFELTFRLRAPAEIVALGDRRWQPRPQVSEAAAAAPIWPLVLLNDLGRYVFEARRPLAHGDFLERTGDPRGEHWALVRDPVLQPVDTVNGRFAWLQLVAIDDPLFRRLHDDAYEQVLAEYARTNPYFVSSVVYPPAGS